MGFFECRTVANRVKLGSLQKRGGGRDEDGWMGRMKLECGEEEKRVSEEEFSGHSRERETGEQKSEIWRKFGGLFVVIWCGD